MNRALDLLATGIHKIHGTRGLLVTGILLLALSIIEPFLPAAVPRILYTLPMAVVLAVAVVTLAREGVAIQDRLLHLGHRADATARLWKHAVIPAVVVVLLLPDLFLAAYGIPHMSPLTGLVLPDVQHRIAVAYLYAILLLVAWSLRRTRRMAPNIRSLPLRELDAAHRTRRDILWWLSIGLITVWLVALSAFWQPFSLFAWPPGLESLRSGVRGLASITYAGALPVLLFVGASAHVRTAFRLWREGPALRRPVPWFAAIAALYLTAAMLHLYDLFWIARYQAQSLF